MSQLKPEEAIGYGLRVGGGTQPYLAWVFEQSRAAVPVTESYHKPIKCVLLTHREWCRLKRAASKRRT